MKHIISLGAGVQSSTMALMAAAGEITPMPDCAIFADTQAEPRAVYKWLDWLEKHLPYPVHRVTAGDLRADSLRLRTSKRDGKKYQRSAPPAFTLEEGISRGMLLRQCTQDHKLKPIFRKMRALAGRKQPVVQWVGISLDEVQRAKPAREAQAKWMTNRWPLIEMKMTRQHCLDWMRAHGYQAPPRSACIFCPYHSDSEWYSLKTDSPDEFAVAVAYERELQKVFNQVAGFRGIVFLHRDRKPLDEVQLDPDAQRDLFDEYGFAVECEGMCGV